MCVDSTHIPKSDQISPLSLPPAHFAPVSPRGFVVQYRFEGYLYGVERTMGVMIVRGVGAGVLNGVGDVPGRITSGVGVGIGDRVGSGVGLSLSSGVGDGVSAGRGVALGVGVGVFVFELLLAFAFTFEFDELVFKLKSKFALAPRLMFAFASRFAFTFTFAFEDEPLPFETKKYSKIPPRPTTIIVPKIVTSTTRAVLTPLRG